MLGSKPRNVGELALIMIGPPIGYYFAKDQKEMWAHGLIIAKKKKTYTVHVNGIIKEVPELFIEPPETK